MPQDYSTDYLKRWAEPDLMELLGSVCPDEDSRRVAAQFVAMSIKTANGEHRARWGITRRRDFLRLTVGRSEAIIWAGGSADMLDMDAEIAELFLEAPFIAVMMDLPTLRANADSRTLEPHLIEYSLPSASESCYLVLPTASSKSLEAGLQLARPAHVRHLERSAQGTLNPSIPRSHHPGVVEAIGGLASDSLPQPEYVRVARS